MRQGGTHIQEPGVGTIPVIFALSHAIFGLLLQISSYVSGLASSPDPIRFGLLDSLLWPMAQLPLVIESGFLLLLWRVLSGKRVLRVGFWVVFVALNFWLCFDQLVFRAFFEHWMPGVVDSPLLMAVLWESVFERAGDGIFFVALATGIALSAVSYQWLFGGPSRLVHLAKVGIAKWAHTASFRLATIGWLSITVIVSAQTDYYKLTEYPLVSLIQRQVLDAWPVAAPDLPIKVALPRLVRRDASAHDVLDGGLGALGFRSTASGARNIVYLKISGERATERWVEATRSNSPTLTSLLSHSLTLDQVYRPTTATAPRNEDGSLFSKEVFLSRNYLIARANASNGISRSIVEAGDDSACDLAAGGTANLFSRHLAESQSASRPLYFEADIDFDWAARSCRPSTMQSGESIANLELLLSGIEAALQGQGVDGATWFVFHVYNDAANVSPMLTSADLRENVTIAAPGQLTAKFHSSRVVYLRELGVDIESLMVAGGSQPIVLGSSFHGHNVFFVRDAPQFRWGVRDGPWWFSANVDGTELTLFQLDADPGEKTNLAATLPKLSDYYQRLTVAWFAQAGPLFGIEPAGFVVAKRGLLPQRYTNFAGPKFIALATSQRTTFRESDVEFVRINPQDPLVATIFMLPYGGAHVLQVDWRLPGGHEESYTMEAQKGWTSLWAYPGGDIPMAEGVGRVAVRSDGVVLLAREFLVTSAVPAKVVVKHSLRALQQLQVGTLDRANATAAKTFVSREQLYTDETPVVRASFAPGRGLRRVRAEWISPTGELYAHEAGLREETNEIWIQMRTKVQPLEIGTWKLLVKQDAVVLGSGEFAVNSRPVEQGAN